MEVTSKDIKLTQFSHGAGCGCKISPAMLSEILSGVQSQGHFENLLVGNDKRDDAAVMDQGDGTGIISTTDFFMPIVDDPITFGKIAAVNALSDIYAMGGKPMMAIAILGWPINKLSAQVAGQVIEGGRQACAEAGIPLAGGHSIDSPEPIFGLAVTGKVDLKDLKENSTAKPGAKLFLTKGLGVGILSTAEKKGLLQAEHQRLAIESMVRLNKIGALLGTQSWVQAMTDVTGFGLFGHLSEMCAGSHCSATIIGQNIPLLDKAAVTHYIGQGAVPGGTKRNWESYGHGISIADEFTKTIGCDPQTSGGLLLAIDADKEAEFHSFLQAVGFNTADQRLTCLGNMTEKQDHLITIV